MLEIKGSKAPKPGYYKPRDKSGDFWKSLLKIIMVVLIITLLLVGAAVLYAWYTSQHDGGGKATVATTKPAPSLQNPHKPAPDAEIGVATQFLSSPVAPGDNATMSIHTNADARCTITVKYDTTTATDSGLMPKLADDYGLAQWSWTVPAATPPTKDGSVDVWCANAKHNAHILGTLVIQAAKS